MRKLIIQMYTYGVWLSFGVFVLLWVFCFCFQCTVGAELGIRVGGDVFFDPDLDSPSPDLLLIAGGIGINPIHSIFSHVTDLLNCHWTNSPRHVSLLYSASSRDELIFHVIRISFWILCYFYISWDIHSTKGRPKGFFPPQCFLDFSVY